MAPLAQSRLGASRLAVKSAKSVVDAGHPPWSRKAEPTGMKRSTFSHHQKYATRRQHSECQNIRRLVWDFVSGSADPVYVYEPDPRAEPRRLTSRTRTIVCVSHAHTAVIRSRCTNDESVAQNRHDTHSGDFVQRKAPAQPHPN